MSLSAELVGLKNDLAQAPPSLAATKDMIYMFIPLFAVAEK
jgi:hypothetical protein